jgi:glycine hydroxymethyltransferase
MDEARSHLLKLLASHETWRSQTINLIASENALSPAVRRALNSDLVQRYGDYSGRDLADRRYRGNRYIEQIEREAVRIAQETFKASYVELRPISGHVAGAAVLMGLCRTGDLVLEPGRDGGGHREGGKFASSAMAPLEVAYLPFDPVRYNIDLERFSDLVHKRPPRVVILGSSNFLFPHPVEQIADLLKTLSPETVLVYDGSHVMGFLAAGGFQHPLEEGAGLVFGSTHKTLPGPQGGIIFSNRDDLMEKVCQATYPALVTNHHLFRIPALALALLEMQQWGAAYTGQVIANAQALGAALEQKGVACVRLNDLYTRSHTILVCVSRFGKGAEMAARLEACGIITTAAHLPEYWGLEGLRLGSQEVTRLGAGPDHMEQIARLIEQALSASRSPEAIRADSASFAAGLGPIQYTWMDESV